jgi:hydrogenase maturation protein HypF
MQTIHIHIEGQVQGVGFRPFVYRLANEEQLTGWVSNGMDGVHIEVTGDEEIIQEFLGRLKAERPPLAIVEQINTREIATVQYPDFTIQESDEKEVPRLTLTPDTAICDDCRMELAERSDRRYDYPFISCVNCGPRFSVIQKLPYDRPYTSMAPFEMCDACSHEYNDPLDRRFFAQIITCPDCRVPLHLYNNSGVQISDNQQTIIKQSARLVSEGKVLAIKCTGGFLFMVDARNSEAILKLRERKSRPEKPFAIMYPTMDKLLEDTNPTEKEKALLSGRISPVVLLKLERNSFDIKMDVFAPGLTNIGAMLPNNPLLQLIMDAIGHPVVATSANLSGSPVVFSNDIALEELPRFVDYILWHEQEITVPLDDSVMRVSEQGQQIIMRRGRGIAPSFAVDIHKNGKGHSYLAMGADLKSSFAFLHQDRMYVSQFLGNMESYVAQKNYRDVQDHLMKMFDVKPESIVVDMHPTYFSKEIGVEQKKKYKIPVFAVQHHFAHFAAVMMEHGMIDGREDVLGVVWDGTGWGTDEQIWGGEFFLRKDNAVSRYAYIHPYAHIAGDRMAMDTRIPALSVFGDIEEFNSLWEELFTPVELKLYRSLIEKKRRLTTSMGRLFDAVACLTGLAESNNYEGQAAILVEQHARAFQQSITEPVLGYLADDLIFSGSLDLSVMLRPIVMDVLEGASAGRIAYRFHLSLVQLIERVAKKSGVQTLCFSGGVFQNALLVDLLLEKMRNTHRLCFHENLSPNDENIAVGQIGAIMMNSGEHSLKGLSDFVEEI